jgi:glycosidase
MDVGAGGKFSHKSWTLDTLRSIVEKWQTLMYENDGWNALFLENHDQSRSVSRFTPNRPEHRNTAAKMLATFIALQAGTLFIYQGQELGMRNLPKTWAIEEYKDVETQNFHRLFVYSDEMWVRASTDNSHSAVKHLSNDEAALNQFLDEVRLKARDHARSPVQVGVQERKSDYCSIINANLCLIVDLARAWRVQYCCTLDAGQ